MKTMLMAMMLAVAVGMGCAGTKAVRRMPPAGASAPLPLWPAPRCTAICAPVPAAYISGECFCDFSADKT